MVGDGKAGRSVPDDRPVLFAFWRRHIACMADDRHESYPWIMLGKCFADVGVNGGVEQPRQRKQSFIRETLIAVLSVTVVPFEVQVHKSL